MFSSFWGFEMVGTSVSLDLEMAEIEPPVTSSDSQSSEPVTEPMSQLRAAVVFGASVGQQLASSVTAGVLQSQSTARGVPASPVLEALMPSASRQQQALCQLHSLINSDHP